MLKILRSNIDGVSAHITVQVCAVETDGDGNVTIGPVEVIGIDHKSLMQKFHSPNEIPDKTTMQQALHRWLAERHTHVVSRKQAIDQTVQAVSELQDKILFQPLGFTDPTDPTDPTNSTDPLDPADPADLPDSPVPLPSPEEPPPVDASV